MTEHGYALHVAEYMWNIKSEEVSINVCIMQQKYFYRFHPLDYKTTDDFIYVFYSLILMGSQIKSILS